MMPPSMKTGGFSLTEMMIALALGSVITLGAVQLYVGNEQNHRLLQGQSRVQESARFALGLMGSAIRRAGYAGCLADGSRIHSVLPADLPWEFDLRSAVAGHEGQGSNWQPDLTSIPSGTGQINRTRLIQGSDLLTLRYLSARDHRLAEPLAEGSPEELPEELQEGTASIKIVTPADQELAEGQLALIHDCQQATAFLVTGVTEADAVTEIQHAVDLVPEGVSADRRGQWKNASADLGAGWGEDAAVSAIESQTWFLARGAGRNVEGGRVRSLWRKFGTARPVELVEGVEEMQLVYGVDTDGDQVPNQYLDASRVSDWARVMTVQVTLVVSSVDDVGAGGDGRLRYRFSQTFQLRNRA